MGEDVVEWFIGGVFVGVGGVVLKGLVMGDGDCFGSGFFFSFFYYCYLFVKKGVEVEDGFVVGFD